jgi:hypothetical protein
MGEKGTVPIQRLQEILGDLNRVVGNIKVLIGDSASPSAEDVLKKQNLIADLTKLCESINYKMRVERHVDPNWFTEAIGKQDEFKSMCATLQKTNARFVTEFLKTQLVDCTGISNTRFQGGWITMNLSFKEHEGRIWSETSRDDGSILLFLTIEPL